jgi:hypothetical protein
MSAQLNERVIVAARGGHPTSAARTLGKVAGTMSLPCYGKLFFD